MPNYCANELKITSVDGATLTRFREENVRDEEELSFECSVPTPPNIETGNLSSLDQNDGENWYRWRVANWGTKSDAIVYGVSHSRNRLDYDFDTAYSPPLNWLASVSQSYPGLDFTLEYHEGGVDIWGLVEYRSGVLSSQLSEPLSEHAWALVGEELLRETKASLRHDLQRFGWSDVRGLRDRDSEYYDTLYQRLQDKEGLTFYALDCLVEQMVVCMCRMLIAAGTIRRLSRPIP